MCFRPPAIHRDPNDQYGECPTCGMPVAAEAGVTSGTCPYCGDPIPPDAPDHFEVDIDPAYSTRIL